MLSTNGKGLKYNTHGNEVMNTAQVTTIDKGKSIIAHIVSSSNNSPIEGQNEIHDWTGPRIYYQVLKLLEYRLTALSSGQLNKVAIMSSRITNKALRLNVSSSSEGIKALGNLVEVDVKVEMDLTRPVSKKRPGVWIFDSSISAGAAKLPCQEP